MNITLSNRRHPYLLGPQGEVLLPPTLSHDRRRRRVVEELLNAMRLRSQSARTARAEKEQAIRHATVRRRFWMALALIAIGFILTMFIVERANQTTYHQGQIAGDSAPY